jgi:hypothetical protein
LGNLFSQVANPILKNSVIRGLVDAFLKIDKRRDIPDYPSITFRQWFRKHQYPGDKKNPSGVS